MLLVNIVQPAVQYRVLALGEIIRHTFTITLSYNMIYIFCSQYHFITI